MNDYLKDIEEINEQSKECRTRYEQIKKDWNNRLFKLMYDGYVDADDGRLYYRRRNKLTPKTIQLEREMERVKTLKMGLPRWYESMKKINQLIQELEEEES